MNTQKKLIFLSIFGLIACTKDIEINQIENLNPLSYKDKISNMFMGLSTSNGYDAVISYTAFGTKELDNTNNEVILTTYDAIGQFLSAKNSQNLVSVGQLQIGSIIVNTDTAKYADQRYKFTLNQITSAANATNFGSNTTFQITGDNGYGASSHTLYIPEEIYLDTVRCNCVNSFPTIDINDLPHRIYWNADPNNANGVVSIIRYNGFLSHELDPTMSAVPFFNNPVLSTDVGYYDITPTDIANIPVGAIIDVYIGRGNDAVINTNGKEIKLECTTHSRRSYKLVN